MIKKHGILYFEKFLQFPKVIHGFSTREFGNMRPGEESESLEKFASILFDHYGKIPPAPLSVKEALTKLVRMHQVHSANVAWVTESRDATVDNTDGMLTARPEVFLSVVTADCVPVLFYDKEKRVVGAVHAGWRGVYKEIVPEAVRQMMDGGRDPKNILVGIGPCIRSCCYDIAEEHAAMFRSKFPEWQDALVKRDGKIFLDLPKLVQYQLRSVRILDTNMEDAGICTYQSEDLYSCRREGEGFGEFVGIIGKIN